MDNFFYNHIQKFKKASFGCSNSRVANDIIYTNKKVYEKGTVFCLKKLRDKPKKFDPICELNYLVETKKGLIAKCSQDSTNELKITFKG